MSILQTLQEQSEDEDKDMVGDDYFKKDKKRKILGDLNQQPFFKSQYSLKSRKGSDELGYLSSMEVPE